MAQLDSEDDTPLPQQPTGVINALSRKYSQKSIDLAIQPSQSKITPKPSKEPDDEGEVNPSRIQTSSQPDTSSSHPTQPSDGRTEPAFSKTAARLFDNIAAIFPNLSKRTCRTENSVVLPPGVHIPQKIVTPVRVEPKVFFANERTYFSWMRFALLLGSFSVALVNTGDKIGKISGLIYTMISLSTLIYGCGLYYRRHELIMARANGPYGKYFGHRNVTPGYFQPVDVCCFTY